LKPPPDPLNTQKEFSMTIFDEFDARKSRFAWNHPAAASAERSLDTALRIGREIAQTRANVEGDKRYSAHGKASMLTEQTRKWGYAMNLVRNHVADFRKTIDDQYSALLPKPKDKTDAAAAILRMDQRNYLRSLPLTERLQLVNSDPFFLEAASESNPVLSGLTPEQHGQLTRAYVAKHHGDSLATIDEQRGQLELLETAVGVTSNDLAAAQGLAKDAFDAWVASAPKP
jgi:phytoene dehydrogenase-like protein